MQNPFKNTHRRVIALLLALNFVFTSSAFGQMIPTEKVAGDDPEIFPFEFSDSEDRWVDYTEDLIEITDDGAYDSEGYEVEVLDTDEVSEGPVLPSEFRKEETAKEQDAFEAYRESIIVNWGGKRAFTERRLEGIQKNLDEEKRHFEHLEKEIGIIEKQLKPIREKIETLKGHIDLLNSQLMLSREKIKSVEYQIAEKQIILKDLMWDLKKSEVAVELQREIVLDYILLVYQEEEKFLDYYDEGSSTLKLLLADNSVSENLLGREYSKILEGTGRKVFYDLHTQKVALQEKRHQLEQERAELNELHKSLEGERRILQEGKESKKELLEETRGEEERYQKLLDKSIQQQLESAIAIQNLQDNIQFIEEKLDLLDESLEKVETFESDLEQAETFESEVEEMAEEIDEEFFDVTEEEVIPKHQAFAWPVPPLAITAYFHDPTYPKRWGIHEAIDIRAPQYTEIRAPANAYVFQTKDNGMGYSYIILAHKNKLITVYGHVAELIAKPGTVVKQGDLIGLTGGTPGTKGAGWQTTGPHLHFEVWHKGEQVDPLDWVPVMELPIEYIPDRYLKELNR